MGLVSLGIKPGDRSHRRFPEPVGISESPRRASAPVFRCIEKEAGVLTTRRRTRGEVVRTRRSGEAEKAEEKVAARGGGRKRRWMAEQEKEREKQEVEDDDEEDDEEEG